MSVGQIWLFLADDIADDIFVLSFVTSNRMFALNGRSVSWWPNQHFSWSVYYPVKFHRTASSSDIDSWFDILDIIAPDLYILVRLYLTLQSDFIGWWVFFQTVFQNMFSFFIIICEMQGTLLILIPAIWQEFCALWDFTAFGYFLRYVDHLIGMIVMTTCTQ